MTPRERELAALCRQLMRLVDDMLDAIPEYADGSNDRLIDRANAAGEKFERLLPRKGARPLA